MPGTVLTITADRDVILVKAFDVRDREGATNRKVPSVIFSQ